MSHQIFNYFACVSTPDRVYLVSLMMLFFFVISHMGFLTLFFSFLIMRLQQDKPDVECWTGEHREHLPLAVMGVIFYIIGIPALFLWVAASQQG